MPVYILHFSKRYHRARHYVGYTEKPERRLNEHLNGYSSGSPLVKAVIAAGIDVTVAAIFSEEGRDFEKKIKRSKNTPKFCPICQELKKSKGG